MLAQIHNPVKEAPEDVDAQPGADLRLAALEEEDELQLEKTTGSMLGRPRSAYLSPTHSRTNGHFDAEQGAEPVAPVEAMSSWSCGLSVGAPPPSSDGRGWWSSPRAGLRNEVGDGDGFVR